MERTGTVRLSTFVFLALVGSCWLRAMAAEEPAGAIAGRVTEVESDSPLMAAVLTLTGTSHQTHSDMEGRYAFVDLEPGRYSLKVELSEHTPVFIRRVKVVPGGTVALDIVMRPQVDVEDATTSERPQPAIILGKVTHAKTDRPLAGAEVRLDGTEHRTQTDEEGVFSFAEAEPGEYSIVLSHPGFDLVRQEGIVAAAGAVVNVSLSATESTEGIQTGELTGTLTDSATGSPIVNGKVAVLGTSLATLSDSNGSFGLNVPVGEHTIVTSARHYTAKAVAGVRVADQPAVLNMPLSRMSLSDDGDEDYHGIIAGTIRDKEGDPCVGAIAFVEETPHSEPADSAGAYRIVNVPEGMYTVKGTHEGFDTAAAAAVDVWHNEISPVDLVLSRTVSPSYTSSERGRGRDAPGGAIAGLVANAETGSPMAGVQLSLAETDLRVLSAVDGKYRFPHVPPGLYTLVGTQSGYAQVSDGAVTVAVDSLSSVDLVMKKSDVTELEGMSIRTVAVKNTGAALLKERQVAISFTDAIGSQEISRTGASNAADAMKSVTGATVVGGKYVLIRGLPERYTITMLNGSPLPSADPNRKAVNMDLFPAGMIENITTSKTYTPDMPASFAGGIMDIKTKPFPDKLQLNISASGSFNTLTTFSDRFLTYEGGDLDWLGFDDGTREIPKVFKEYRKDDIDKLAPKAEVEFNSRYLRSRIDNPNDKILDTLETVDAFAKALNTEMDPHRTQAYPNQSYSLSLGNTFRPVERPLGILLGATYSNKYSLSRNNISRVYAFNPVGADPSRDFDLEVTEASHTVLWGILGSGAYEFSDDHRANVNYMYTRNAIDEVSRRKGTFTYYFPDKTYFNSRLRYTERAVNYIQPSGRHRFWIARHPFHLSWRGAYTRSTQSEPDMRQYYYFYDDFADSSIHIMKGEMTEPLHEWRDLSERSGSAGIKLAIPFWQWNGDSATIGTGASLVRTVREQRQRTIWYQMYDYFTEYGQATVPPSDLIAPKHLGLLEDTISATGYAKGLFVEDHTDIAAQWDGAMTVFSAFAMLELPLAGNLSTTLGLRYERAHFKGQSVSRELEGYQQVSGDTALGLAELDDHDFLPAVAFTCAVGEKMSVRAAYGRTLIRPSMREKADFMVEPFAGGPPYRGNPDLERYFVDNVDGRWEWYMKPGELLALSVFYKKIHEPIEITFLHNDIRQPENTAADVDLVGCEVEARKQLDMVKALEHLQLAGNLTFAWSRVELTEGDTSKAVQGTAKNKRYFPDEPMHRPFQGQSPFVANLFLTYDNPDIGTNVNVLFNVFGRRLGELTDPDHPWMWEEPQPLLDITASQDLGERWCVKVKASNILGSPKTQTHHYLGDRLLITRENPGRGFSLGLSFSL